MNNNIKKRYARRLEEEKVFKPMNSEHNTTTEINLDELEAMRLCDYELLSQIEASEQMQVSRATIQRLLIGGRKKVIDSFLSNKAIVIKNNISNIALKGENNIDHHTKEKFMIAVPTNDKEKVSINFGGAKYLAVYAIENKEVQFIKFLEMPVHAQGKYPEFLKNNLIDIVVVRTMGSFAIEECKTANIEVILGAQGKFEEVINEYINGVLNFEKQSAEYSRRKGCLYTKGNNQGNGRGKGLGRGKKNSSQQGLGLGRNKRC